MSSSSLLPNKAFNRLSVNRLNAQSIRSDNIIPSSPSFLFSILFKFSTFIRNNTGGKLIINVDQKNDSVIQFSDRPFRQTNFISLLDFILLFFSNQQNSFTKDPPNAVLTHKDEQRTYKMTMDSINDKELIFNMDLLPGESHGLGNIEGQMSLFVDSAEDGVGTIFHSDAEWVDTQFLVGDQAIYPSWVAYEGIRRGDDMDVPAITKAGLVELEDSARRLFDAGLVGEQVEINIGTAEVGSADFRGDAFSLTAGLN